MTSVCKGVKNDVKVEKSKHNSLGMCVSLKLNALCLLVHTRLSSIKRTAAPVLTHSHLFSRETATTLSVSVSFSTEVKSVCFQKQNVYEYIGVPLQVNATGVMPVIFSSSLLALPTALARYANSRPVEAFAAALNPSGPFYLPVCSISNACTGDLLS